MALPRFRIFGRTFAFFKIARLGGNYDIRTKCYFHASNTRSCKKKFYQKIVHTKWLQRKYRLSWNNEQFFFPNCNIHYFILFIYLFYRLYIPPEAKRRLNRKLGRWIDSNAINCGSFNKFVGVKVRCEINKIKYNKYSNMDNAFNALDFF